MGTSGVVAPVNSQAVEGHRMTSPQPKCIPTCGVIYLIKNLVNGKVYVGQTVKSSILGRWREHKHHALKGGVLRIHKAIRKYGVESFSIEVLCKCPGHLELDEAERFYIWMLGATKQGFGYNLTTGGTGCRGTLEVRQRISDKFKGRIGPMAGKRHSEETKEKMRNARLGIPLTPEHRKNLSLAHKGLPILAATKEKLRAALLGRIRGPMPEEWRKTLSEAAKRRVARDGPPMAAHRASITILTQSDVDSIRDMARSGLSHQEISTNFPVSRRHISDIIAGRRWQLSHAIDARRMQMRRP